MRQQLTITRIPGGEDCAQALKATSLVSGSEPVSSAMATPISMLAGSSISRGNKLRFNPDYDQLERQCNKCKEWWPADREFFFLTGKAGSGVLHCTCKACYTEWRRSRRSIPAKYAGKEVSSKQIRNSIS